MFMSAPTPVPFAFKDANSSGRSSSFVNCIDILRPPSPSGTLTLALQWVSSAISKLSTPGIVFAIFDGSLITLQTTARGASNSFVPSIFTMTSSQANRPCRDPALDAAPLRPRSRPYHLDMDAPCVLAAQHPSSGSRRAIGLRGGRTHLHLLA